MADKNVVDDYYSNISGKENEGDKKNDKKPVVKAKRKVVIKKPKTTKPDNASVEKTKAPKHKKHNIKTNRLILGPPSKVQYIFFFI